MCIVKLTEHLLYYHNICSNAIYVHLLTTISCNSLTSKILSFFQDKLTFIRCKIKKKKWNTKIITRKLKSTSMIKRLRFKMAAFLSLRAARV